MNGVRFRKLLRELWNARARTLLVVLSIAVGVFAVGTIVNAQLVMTRDLQASYAAIHPASATLSSSTFGDELLQAVRRMPEIAAAEGRRNLPVRLQIGADDWRDLQMFALADFDAINVSTISPQQGQWPPPAREILLERASLAYLGLQIGDTVLLRAPNGTERTVRIAGTAHDLAQMPPVFDGTIYGYTTLETLEWFGEPYGYNELRIVVAGPAQTVAAIQQVAEQVDQRMTRTGLEVYQVLVPVPGRHPLGFVLDTISLVLGLLGLLALALSGFLVANTVAALITQQIRQIGVLKAIGARSGQIATLYLAAVLVYGLLALTIAAPLGILGTQALTGLLAGLINFDNSAARLPPLVLALQALVALAVPMLAALLPVASAARMTVRDALNAEARPAARATRRGAHSWTGAVTLALALRNTFRRRGRLLLTLTTLTLAGAIFMSVLNLRIALLDALDQVIGFYRYDLMISLARPYRVERLSRQASQVPGVTATEGWNFAMVQRVRPDGSEGAPVYGMFMPAETERVQVPLIEGRWLRPEDQQALVITSGMLRDEADLHVGSELILKIEGEETSWRVVGIALGIGPTLYGHLPHYAQLTHEIGQVNALVVQGSDRSLAARQALARELERQFDQAGLCVTSVLEISREIDEVHAAFDVVILLLLVMAALLAVVGGLGLMGSMSLNVLERTREIGVLRAIGASHRALIQIIVAEGLVIGGLSWLLGAILAVLLSPVLGGVVGLAFVNTPLPGSIAAEGILLWLVLVLLLASSASLLPALNAARIPVRATLAYE